MDAFITRRGGGGAGLNFTIVGGTNQPENPKENTIWVNTDQKITGWSVSPNEPTEPVVGMVWLVNGLESSTPMDVLEENEILICPREARQYTENGWARLDALIYTNGEWKNWYQYLLTGIDKCTDVTGGWVVSFMGLSAENSYNSNMTATDYGDHVKIKESKQLGNDVYRTSKAISFVGYNELVLDIDVKNNSSKLFNFRLLTTIGSHINANAAYSKHLNDITGRETVIIDISNLNSAYYVVFSMYCYGSDEMDVDIYNVYLK